MSLGSRCSWCSLWNTGKGIALLTDQKVPEREIIHNVRITRCLFYVSDVLRQVIENDGIQVRTAKNSEMLPLPSLIICFFTFINMNPE